MPPKKVTTKKPAAEGTRKSTRAVAPKPAAEEPVAAPKKPAATKKKAPKAAPEVDFPNLPAAKKKAAAPSISPPAAPTKVAPKKAATKEKAPVAKATTKKAPAAAKTTTKAAAKKTAEPTKKAVGRPRKASPEASESPEAPKAKVNGKRKAPESDDEDEDDEDDEEDEKPKAKRAKTAAKPAVKKVAKVSTVAKPKVVKPLKVLNEIPTTVLKVFVCGENSAGELGLGYLKYEGKNITDVKRPRLNPLLDPESVGIVAIATGGMHCIAITKDNKILTWGVNDQGALGRETPKRVVEDGDAESDDEDDTGLSPAESTPGEVDNKYFPEGTKFVKVVASDSASFVLTADGFVYGWGTFRGNEGIIGFSPETKQANFPVKISALAKVKHIAAGANHVMALTHTGATYGWGASEQSQLGRRTVERTKTGALVPREFGLPSKGKNRIAYVSCGSYHSFAIDTNNKVWSWGLNNFAETGIVEGAGEDEAFVNKPTIVESLSEYTIKEIKGGGHHSIACTDDGKLLTWGRIDGHQVGIDIADLPDEDIIKDTRNEPRILKVPTVIPDIHAVHVTAASDTSIAIDKDGKAYSWGFSTNYQTGQGTIEDIEEPTLVDNTAVRDEKLNSAGLGGQFAIFTSIATPMANGSA